MNFEQVCQSLNVYFGQKPLFKVLLPLSVPLMFVCVILQELGRFVSLGSVVSALSFIGFFVGILLVLSNCNFKMAAIGFGIYALGYVYNVLLSLIKYQYINYSSIIYLLLYGFFAYEAYKKTIKVN